MAKAEKKETVEVEFTPEQKSFQAHIQSLTTKINQHLFEIEELLPSLRTYEQTLANSLQNNANDNPKEDEK